MGNILFFEVIIMKKTILLTLSHLLVAVLAAVLALQLTPRAEPSKLDQLEDLIVEQFIGGADKTAIEVWF